MKLKSTLVALALSVSGAAAFAADTTIAWNPDYSIGNFFANYSGGDTIDERFGFTVNTPSFVTASLITNSLDTLSGLDLTTVSLTTEDSGGGGGGTSGATTNLLNLDLGSTTLEGSTAEAWALGRTQLDPGTYFLSVNGTVGGSEGGGFSGVINVSPVPEPETYALMLAGLGMVGFLARRRQKS